MTKAKPKVAVVGACVSRDLFNRRFAPEYKEKVILVESIYQSAMPSLSREESIQVEIPETLQPQFRESMRREYDGQNLARLALSAADIIVFDFFADIHLGITNVNGHRMTRNHMAFNRTADADVYFDDSTLSKPDRMRYEAGVAGVQYHELALGSMRKILDVVNERSREPLFVLNSARLSKNYINESGNEEAFPKVESLVRKNGNWDVIDETFQQLTQCVRIDYPEELFKGDVGHPWGKHAAHYAQPYYDYFWNRFDQFIL